MNPIEAVGKMLCYFVKRKVYSYVDKLSRPFTYEDVERAMVDAVRHAKTIKSSKPNEDVYIPPKDIMNRFLEMCKDDLGVARRAAIMALICE